MSAPPTTMQPFTLTIPGEPVPKGRPRLARHGHTYTPTKTQNAEKRIAWAYHTARGPHHTGPVAVTAAFHRHNRHRVDLDNLVKTVLDALNGHAWDDDAQVVTIHATKHIDPTNPRTTITIEGNPA